MALEGKGGRETGDERKGRDFLTGNCVCDGYQDGNLKPHCMLVIIL